MNQDDVDTRSLSDSELLELAKALVGGTQQRLADALSGLDRNGGAAVRGRSGLFYLAL